MALTSLPATAQINCGKTRFFYIHNREKIFKTEDYCLDKKSGALYNEACKDKSCLKEFTQTHEKLLVGKKPGYGTTGFWVCHNLGGSPQIIKVLGEGDAVTTMDRCLLKNGGVIDTGSLEMYFKNRAN